MWKPRHRDQKRSHADEARSRLNVVKEIQGHLGLTNLDATVLACSFLASREALLDVAVLGQFKAGKSSLLNAVMGFDLLPVGVVPVTAVVTRLVGGDVVSASATLLDGRK